MVVAIAYIPVAFWMLKSPDSSTPYFVAIAGTIGIIVLYAVTRTDAGAIAFGLEHAGKIGHLGMDIQNSSSWSGNRRLFGH